MSEHYFSRTPQSESDPDHWSFSLLGHTFIFKTDRGVFSKRTVDFGSRLLIETFRPPDLEGDILDVGCGYGPIGLALAKSTGRTVHMVDINERALLLCRENASLNQVANVRIYESDRLEGVREKDFAAIVTNPPVRAGKKVVYDIFEQSYDHLKAGGELWIVIQKKQGAPSAEKKLAEIFDEVEVVKKKKGYFIIKAKKLR